MNNHATPRFLPALASAILLFAAGAGWAGNTGSTAFDCLDGVPVPSYRAALTYYPSFDYEDAGSGSGMEFDVDWELGYYRISGRSVVDTRGVARLTFLSGSGDLDLPSQLVRIALDAGWTWDFAPDYALAVRAYPGYYADLRGLDFESLSVPLSGAVRRELHPQLSVIAGFEYRHGFGDPFVPVLGADWEINEMSRLRIGFPETRYDLYLSRAWGAAAGIEWENVSYDLHDGSDQMTQKGCRWYIEGTRRLSDQLELGVRVGGVAGRTLEFRQRGSRGVWDVDVSGGSFVTVGVRGPF